MLIGKKSWVGFYPLKENSVRLPKIKPGILSPLDGMKQQTTDKEVITRLNILYTRDYTVWKDLNIMFFAFRNLGRKF